MPRSRLASLLTTRLTRWAITLWLVVIPLLILLSAAVLAFALRGSAGVGVAIAGVGLGVVFVGVAAGAIRSGSAARLQGVGLLAFVPCLIAIALALPRMNDLWVSRTLAAHLRHLDPARLSPVAAVGSDDARGIVGFQEDSLVFELRGGVERITPDQLDAWLAQNRDGIAIVPTPMLVGHRKYLPHVEVNGFNYSKGRLTYLCVSQVHP